MSKQQKRKKRLTGLQIVDKVWTDGSESEPAQETGSDRKDAKTAIHGSLGPRDYLPHP
jgi:hypothetical protein